jgi:hypothetical protein
VTGMNGRSRLTAALSRKLPSAKLANLSLPRMEIHEYLKKIESQNRAIIMILADIRIDIKDIQNLLKQTRQSQASTLGSLRRKIAKMKAKVELKDDVTSLLREHLGLDKPDERPSKQFGFENTIFDKKSKRNE